MRSFRTNPFHRLGVLAVVAAAVVLGGCGKSTGSVTGKVTYKGKALTSGTVSFIGDSGTAFALIQPDGTYSIPVAPVGKVAITVTTPKVPDAPQMMDPSKMGKEGPAPEVKAAEVEAPPRYADAKSTPLTHEVTPGSQVKNLDLD